MNLSRGSREKPGRQKQTEGQPHKKDKSQFTAYSMTKVESIDSDEGDGDHNNLLLQAINESAFRNITYLETIKQTFYVIKTCLRAMS